MDTKVTKNNEVLDSFFTLASMLDDDISLIVAIIHIHTKTPIKKINSDLEALKIDKYASAIDAVLDLRATTLQDIKKLHKTTPPRFVL